MVWYVGKEDLPPRAYEMSEGTNNEVDIATPIGVFAPHRVLSRPLDLPPQRRAGDILCLSAHFLVPSMTGPDIAKLQCPTLETCQCCRVRLMWRASGRPP